eukprot:m.228253 g.228253  ORF g.228253 m.228253 type:complete len:168 (+) comp40043_c0_seq33:4462-4965(+)
MVVFFLCELHIAEVRCYRDRLVRWKVHLREEDAGREPTPAEIDECRLKASAEFLCVRKHIQTTSRSFQMLLSAYFLLYIVWIGVAACLSFNLLKDVGKQRTGACYFKLWSSRVSGGLKNLVDCVCLLSIEEQKTSGFLFQRQEDINTFCDGVKHALSRDSEFFTVLL